MVGAGGFRFFRVFGGFGVLVVVGGGFVHHLLRCCWLCRDRLALCGWCLRYWCCRPGLGSEVCRRVLVVFVGWVVEVGCSCLVGGDWRYDGCIALRPGLSGAICACLRWDISV